MSEHDYKCAKYLRECIFHLKYDLDCLIYVPKKLINKMAQVYLKQALDLAKFDNSKDFEMA